MTHVDHSSGLCKVCSDEDRRIGRARAPPERPSAEETFEREPGTVLAPERTDNTRAYTDGGWFYSDEEAFREVDGLLAENIKATEKCYICKDHSAKKPAFDLGGYGCVGEPGQMHPMCWTPDAVHVECWIKSMTTGTGSMCPNGCRRHVLVEDMQSATAINYRRLRGMTRLRQAQDTAFELALEADQARDREVALTRPAATQPNRAAPVTARAPVTAQTTGVLAQRRMQIQQAAENRRNIPSPATGAGTGPQLFQLAS